MSPHDPGWVDRAAAERRAEQLRAQEATLVGRLRAAGCVFAEQEAALLLEEAGSDHARLEAMTVRRVVGEPLEHVVGWAEFSGLRVPVSPGVFVPRRRSEFLAEQAAALARRGAVVVELCCGAAAVALAVHARVPEVELHAADLDPAAVAQAAANLAGVGTVWAGDLFAALPPELRGRVDVLVANAPYVPSDELAFMPAEAREHEPWLALDGGLGGLDLHRRIAAGAPDWLAPGGSVLIETSEHQATGTAAALAAAGLAARILRDEELEATVVIGTLVIGTAAARSGSAAS